MSNDRGVRLPSHSRLTHVLLKAFTQRQHADGGALETGSMRDGPEAQTPEVTGFTARTRRAAAGMRVQEMDWTGEP